LRIFGPNEIKVVMPQRCGVSRSPGLDQAGLVGQDDGLGAVVQAELGENPRDVGLDGGITEERLASDVGVGHAAGEQAHDLQLAGGEIGQGVGLAARRV
jgi:hypothetical protein